MWKTFLFLYDWISFSDLKISLHYRFKSQEDPLPPRRRGICRYFLFLTFKVWNINVTYGCGRGDKYWLSTSRSMNNYLVCRDKSISKFYIKKTIARGFLGFSFITDPDRCYYFLLGVFCDFRLIFRSIFLLWSKLSLDDGLKLPSQTLSFCWLAQFNFTKINSAKRPRKP